MVCLAVLEETLKSQVLPLESFDNPANQLWCVFIPH
jgi:hypothetical protein